MPPIDARNSAGYDAPIGLTADPVVFTLVEGRLTQNRWEAPDGRKMSRLRVTAESVQFLGSRDDSGGGQSGGFTPRSDVPVDDRDFQPATAAATPSNGAPSDDDIPF